jgi:hypothetical protein
VNTSTDPISQKALDCFVHGVAHLIDEQGKDSGLETARMALALIEEDLDEPSLASNRSSTSRSES